jgi:hypothetical protein
MGNCIYCGKPAGLLRSKHAECDTKEKTRLAVVKGFKAKLQDSIVVAVMQPSEAGRIKDLIDEAARSGKLTQDEMRDAIVAGWCISVDKCLEDGVIDVDEEAKLLAMKNGFRFTEEDLDKTGAHTRLVKAAVIRDVLSGIVPERLSLAEPFQPSKRGEGRMGLWWMRILGGQDQALIPRRFARRERKDDEGRLLQSGCFQRVSCFQH